ncbi:MAG: hypothetical protein ACODAJ_04410 [Planctomycetota bacterium]
MAIRPATGLAALLSAAVAFAGASSTREEGPDTLRKRAQAVSSYIVFCETVARVGLQVGGMVERNPYEKPLVVYARELTRLHVRLYSKLTPPPGAETLHQRFKAAVEGAARAAKAHAKADYATAQKHRKQALGDFLKAIAEINRLKKTGTIPGYVPASSGKK